MNSTEATVVDQPDAATGAAASPAGEAPTGELGAPANQPPARLPARPRSFWRRVYESLEARLSRLSVRNNFWHRICTWVFLPLAYRSGIKFSRGDESTFSAILPFRKFNKNWYNAMAGGALLGNAEVAGGMYVFRQCGADYTVVCKHLEYTFRRPCHGPAVYRVEPREDIQKLVAEKGEFNITVDMTIVQMVRKPDQRERRCGNCVATFHVTPKEQVRRRTKRRRDRETQKSEAAS
jgi:acyl-coenzyme A thioesterase PaaI-like protein